MGRYDDTYSVYAISGDKKQLLATDLAIDQAEEFLIEKRGEWLLDRLCERLGGLEAMRALGPAYSPFEFWEGLVANLYRVKYDKSLDSYITRWISIDAVDDEDDSVIFIADEER